DRHASRYLSLQAKYRAPLNYSTAGIAGADRALKQLRGRLADWARESPTDLDGAAEFEARFQAAISDDLDLPAAMALVAEVVRSRSPASAKASLLKRWDAVLGLELERATPDLALPKGAAALLEARIAARAAKDFAKSDE